MEDNLEVYFCEICNESVPARDLEFRRALSLKGKVIGTCCLDEVRGPKEKKGSSSAGLTAVGVILLAGLAAATVHLDWRLSEETGALAEGVKGVISEVEHQKSLWADLNEQLDESLRKDALTPLETRIQALEGKVADSGEQVLGRIGALRAQFGGLEERVERLRGGLATQTEAIGDLEKEVLRLPRDVAAAAAALPPLAPAQRSRPREAGGSKEPVAEKPGLPADLMRQVERLKDSDAGNRFEAVDQLVQSGDPAVREHLLPMIKDADPFVRRLTAEGLGSFRHASCVDALLNALRDAESIVRHTAYMSLKKLTGQKLAFDPDGSSSSRATAQRRWKEWWAKNREKF